MKMSQGQYASLNGLNLYYEVYGAGQPLIFRLLTGFKELQG
jgi:hypothetical protein